MYRIKNDKRILRSAEIIRSGLMKCLKNKPISEVSVSEIAAAGNVSRATFYRIFDTPIDVLTYICDSLAADVVAEHSTYKTSSRDEFVLHTLDLWMQRSDLLEAVMRSGRPDILQNAFSKQSEKYSYNNPQMFDKAEMDYVKTFFATTICGILYVWASRGKKESAVQLLNIFKKLSLL